MRKFIFVLSLIGLFTFWSPKVSADNDPPCKTQIIICEDNSQHIVIVCNHEDLIAWFEILCGTQGG